MITSINQLDGRNRTKIVWYGHCEDICLSRFEWNCGSARGFQLDLRTGHAGFADQGHVNVCLGSTVCNPGSEGLKCDDHGWNKSGSSIFVQHGIRL